MREIIRNKVILARHIKKEDLKPGLNFFSHDEEFIQVGIWGHYEKGKELAAHVHKKFDRKADRTYEVLFVLSGSLKATIYDFENNVIEKIEVQQGEILVLLECGHGYEITSDDTTVLEIKNGPYSGAEKDRYRIP